MESNKNNNTTGQLAGEFKVYHTTKDKQDFNVVEVGRANEKEKTFLLTNQDGSLSVLRFDPNAPKNVSSEQLDIIKQAKLDKQPASMTLSDKQAMRFVALAVKAQQDAEKRHQPITPASTSASAMHGMKQDLYFEQQQRAGEFHTGKLSGSSLTKKETEVLNKLGQAEKSIVPNNLAEREALAKSYPREVNDAVAPFSTLLTGTYPTVQKSTEWLKMAGVANFDELSKCVKHAAVNPVEHFKGVVNQVERVNHPARQTNAPSVNQIASQCVREILQPDSSSAMTLQPQRH